MNKRFARSAVGVTERGERMRFPKLKQALLCRLLMYAVVLSAFITPIVIVATIQVIPAVISALFGISMGIGLLVYLIKNFIVLMAMDTGLATLHCYQTARKEFDLPKTQKTEQIEKRLSSFGKGYIPLPIEPKPNALRYRFNSPVTIYSKGIERIVITYHVDLLDKSRYLAILQSATANSKALTGKKKALLLDKSQKNAPLNRVTVAAIFANKVDPEFSAHLYDTVCKQEGDGFETAFLPCVIDLQKQTCVFNSMRIPYCGFAYPVKNRGIRIIRKAIFGGKLPLKSNDSMLDPIKDVDPEQSLWQFWHNMKKELVLQNIENKKRFETMQHGQIVLEDDFLYIKWEERGVWVAVELDKETKTAKIDPIHSWEYPKANAIAKKTIEDVKASISAYFAELGYSCEFSSLS